MHRGLIFMHRKLNFFMHREKIQFLAKVYISQEDFIPCGIYASREDFIPRKIGASREDIHALQAIMHCQTKNRASQRKYLSLKVN